MALAISANIFLMPRVKLFDEKEILNRALELFWKKGFHATSIQDLVNHLGINRASLYDTFGGKKELFDRAFQHYRTINAARVITFFEEQSNTKEAFRKLFETAINQSIKDPDRKGCFVVNTITELTPGDQEIQAILAENSKTFEHIFYKFLKAGEKKGDFPAGKDLKAIASTIFTFYNGLQVLSKIQPIKKKMLKTVDEILALLD